MALRFSIDACRLVHEVVGQYFAVYQTRKIPLQPASIADDRSRKVEGQY